jgi:hypothetical protein
MTDEGVVDTTRWIESIDFSTTDAATCAEVGSAHANLDDWLDETVGEQVVRLTPPLCPIHRHTPLRKMAA